MKIFEKLIRRASHKALGDLGEDENYLFLRKNYLFKELSAEAFLFIMKRLVERRYTHDELIFKQDNLGICLFVVKQGSIEIYIRPGENEKIVYATVKEGGLFGEMSLISASYRTATAKAAENDTILLTLSTFDIEALSDQFPKDGFKILKGITDTVAENLMDTTKNLRSAEMEIRTLNEKLAKYERG
jgi:CRP-like cAMP-binding protein